MPHLEGPQARDRPRAADRELNLTVECPRSCRAPSRSPRRLVPVEQREDRAAFTAERLSEEAVLLHERVRVKEPWDDDDAEGAKHPELEQKERAPGVPGAGAIEGRRDSFGRPEGRGTSARRSNSLRRQARRRPPGRRGTAPSSRRTRRTSTKAHGRPGRRMRTRCCKASRGRRCARCASRPNVGTSWRFCKACCGTGAHQRAQEDPAVRDQEGGADQFVIAKPQSVFATVGACCGSQGFTGTTADFGFAPPRARAVPVRRTIHGRGATELEGLAAVRPFEPARAAPLRRAASWSRWSSSCIQRKRTRPPRHVSPSPEWYALPALAPRRRNCPGGTYVREPRGIARGLRAAG
jgi:hypothetical protein